MTVSLYRSVAIAGLLAALTPLSAIQTTIAQTQDGREFTAEFFTEFAPRTAIDMLVQVPGFQIREGDLSQRGLGQGGANVLINGERLTGKTSVRAQLGRIPSETVTKIEILDGTSLDIPGLSGQVANIVTESDGGTSGTWSWSPQFRPQLPGNLGTAKVNVTGTKGNLSYSAELRNESFRNGHWGPEFVTLADGRQIERRDERAWYYGDTPGAALDLSWKPKDEHIGNLNLEYNQFNFNGRENSDRVALEPEGQDLLTRFSNAEDEWNASAGADFEHPLGPGKLKTTGYYRAEHSPTISRYDEFDPVIGQTSGSRYFRTADEGEAILRSEYSLSPKEGHDWQVALEGAFNFLDIEAELFVFDGTDYAPIDVSDQNSRVEEDRAEITLTHNRPLSAEWKVQASLGMEYSVLSQTGGLEREFVRPKGFVTATYAPTEDLNIRFNLSREVGQLNFFDFISATDVRDDFDSTGNINLVPQQSWSGFAEYDRDFGQGNVFKIRLFAEQIEDLVDRIPIGMSGDAVGNIDSAFRYGVNINGTLKSERFGYKGHQLDYVLNLAQSHVDDPLTGEERQLNNTGTSYWEISYRHDIDGTDWAWGAYMEQFVNAPVYRLNTINDFHFNGPWGSAFIEHKDFYGLKVRANLRNLFDATDDFERQVFTNRRDIGVLDFTESHSREFGRFVSFEVSGTF